MEFIKLMHETGEKTVAELTEKGYVSANYSVRLASYAHCDFTASYYLTDTTTIKTITVEGIVDEPLAEFVSRIHAAVTSRPTADEAAREAWRKKMVENLAEAETHGVELSFINPLIEQMNALASNAIEDLRRVSFS